MERQPQDCNEMIARMGELSRTDPEAFEAMRKLLIEQTIEGFPPEHRARAYGMQFRIDAELSRYKDPLARMNKMVEIFWQGVYRFQEVISDPGAVLREREEQRHTAQVIPFPNKPTH